MRSCSCVGSLHSQPSRTPRTGDPASLGPPSSPSRTSASIVLIPEKKSLCDAKSRPDSILGIRKTDTYLICLYLHLPFLLWLWYLLEGIHLLSASSVTMSLFQSLHDYLLNEP